VLENLLVLNEEKCMAKYSLNEFKNFFKSTLLLESVNDEDNLMLEKAHAYYEMSMLSETKSSWFESNESPVYLDAEDHMILVSNNEAFIIEKSTYQAINEWWSWEDVKGAWKTFSTKVVKVAQNVSKGAVKVYNEMSDGAKKAWEWVKSAGSAVVKFLKGMKPLEWASLATGVLSAVIGVIGTGIPGATIIAGALLGITGGIHVYEGIHKFDESITLLKSVEGDLTKHVAAISQALPDLALGAVFTILGLHDVGTGLSTALVNPAAGIESLAMKNRVIAGGKSIAKKMTHNLEHTLGGGWAGKAMANLGKNDIIKSMAEKAAGFTAMQLAGVLGHGVLVSCLGWVYKGCLKAGAAIMKGISWILDLPQKITNGINTLKKNAKGAIGTIIAKGLGTLVSPMSSSAATFINKYIKPSVDKAKKWFDRQVIIYDVCAKAVKEEKGKIAKAHESLLTEEEDDSIPGIEKTDAPQGEIKIVEDPEPEKATPEDEKLLKKIDDEKIDKTIEDETGSGYNYKELAKEESHSPKMRYLKLFENFK
jgi:hypothetical protein